jgi:aspartate dehydrogenase
LTPSDRNQPRQVALIGFGALGQAIAAELDAGKLPGVCLQGALLPPGAHRVAPDRCWANVEDLLAAEPDLVVEVAGHAALSAHAAACLRGGRDLVVASIGALLDATLQGQLWDAAADGHSRLLLPSGALGGLDYLRAARRVGPVQVCYRGRKPLAAWKGTAAEMMLDLASVREATTFFRGHAAEAARQFPQNANVVAALALAVGSPDAVSVELVADPHATRNVHEVDATGPAGNLRIAVENLPMPGNPKTSRVTAFSVLDAISSCLCKGLC